MVNARAFVALGAIVISSTYFIDNSSYVPAAELPSQQLSPAGIGGEEDDEEVQQCANFTGSLPKLIVAGVQKGGTTALLKMMDKIHQIKASRGFEGLREAHFFDFFLERRKPPSHLVEEWDLLRQSVDHQLSPDMLCHLRIQYSKFWNRGKRVDPRLVTMEKTPSYFCNSHVPNLIRQVAPDAKVVIIIRNPTDRTFSGFDHEKQLRKYSHIPKKQRKISTVVAEKIEELRKEGLTNAPPLEVDPVTGSVSYNNQSTSGYSFDPPPAANWDKLSYCDNLLERGLYAKELKPWLEQGFEVGKNLLVLNYEEYLANNREVVGQIGDYLGLHGLEKYSTAKSSSAGNANKYEKKTDKPTATTREYLKQFYKPYNDELAKVLGTSWQGVWD